MSSGDGPEKSYPRVRFRLVWVVRGGGGVYEVEERNVKKEDGF